MAYSQHGGGEPSLAVRLMSVAAEYELQTRKERSRWESKIADLTATNAELEKQGWAQANQIESLSRKLEAAVAEMQKFTDSHVCTVCRRSMLMGVACCRGLALPLRRGAACE
jgi:hypothetical protein